MVKYAFFCYWENVEQNMLETCLASLREVDSSCVIVVVTDDLPPMEYRERLRRTYQIVWIILPTSRVRQRRATCKIEVLQSYVGQLNNGDSVLVSDVDVVFCEDPFVPFQENPQMDLGLTTRGYSHLFPINAGVFFLRVSQRIKDWLHWHLGEIYKPTWAPYVNLRRTYRHDQRRHPLDWTVSQDFLIANWLNRQEVKANYGVEVIDVGPKYNYCPATDTMGAEAFTLAREALKDTSEVAVLHLKSQLKSLIYEPDFPNAKINSPKGRTAWV